MEKSVCVLGEVLSLLSQQPSAFSAWGHHNKLPHTGGLERTEIFSLPALDGEVVDGEAAPSEQSGGEGFHTCSGLWFLITLASASIFTCLLLFCL